MGAPPIFHTLSGRKVNLLAPMADDIDLGDITHALAMQCRYNGNIPNFLSVAEHSILVASLVPAELRLAALLHDAAETYIGDIVRPLKHQEFMAEFIALEDLWLNAIEEHFGIARGLTRHDAVHSADRDVTKAEVVALNVGCIVPVVAPRPVSFEFYAPMVARDRFRAAFSSLGLALVA